MVNARLLLGSCFAIVCSNGLLAAVPQSPRIGNVEILADQGWLNNPATIWYDNFDNSQFLSSRYLESPRVTPISYEALGGSGRSVRARWRLGQIDAGNLKKTFGRNPMDYKGFAARPTEDFTEIYWRQYVKMQEGWVGQPAKLSRASSFSASNWSQAMVAHVWEDNGSLRGLGLDPVRGVNSNSQVVTNGWNDFSNFSWLGKTNASSQIFDTAESGRWVSVEGRVKLNSPGKTDGIFQLWIDGQLEASNTNLNWIYSWNEYGINAVFLENFWNSGSSVAQERYFDDFVISTAPIGPAKSPLNPLVTKTTFKDPEAGDTQSAWQLQIASNLSGNDLVWESESILGEGLSIEVNDSNGTFQGSLSGTDRLLEEQLYALRVRQQGSSGQWSSWSPWNTSLQTGQTVALSGDFDGDNDVDGADFLVWQRDTSIGSLSDWQTNFGTTSAASTGISVPEPSSSVLVGISTLLAVLLGSYVTQAPYLSRRGNGQ